jgi:hypothetical protein
MHPALLRFHIGLPRLAPNFSLASDWLASP